jgi:hypothetical protein
MFNKFSMINPTVIACAFLLACVVIFAKENSTASDKNIKNENQKSCALFNNSDIQNKKEIKVCEKTSHDKKEKEIVQNKIIGAHDKSHVVMNKEVKEEEPKKEIKVILNKEPKARTITISNEITDDMLTYKKHWSGHHSPSKFVMTINDQEVRKGESTAIKLTGDDVVKVSFNYEFRALGRVQRTGGRVLEFKIPQEVEKITSTFSWDAPSNIVLDKGQLVASQEIS